MIIEALNVQDAISKAEEILKCKHRQFRVITHQKPLSVLWGLIRRKGVYEVILKKVEPNKELQGAQGAKDGSVQILHGEVKVTEPIGTGRYPSIIAGDPGVDVYVNGKKILGGYIITGEDRIRLVPKRIPPKTEIKVQVSEDKMKAYLTISQEPGKIFYVEDTEPENSIYIRTAYQEVPASKPTMEQCIEALRAENILEEYINKNAIEEFLETNSEGKVLAAQGRAPIHGIDSKIKLFFKNEKYRNPDLDTDKAVNLLDYIIIPSVKIGEVLAAKLTPAIPGRDGVNVRGEVVKAKDGKEIELAAGMGTTLIENSKIVAAINGRPVFEKGVISVVPLQVIPGDVDANTGNIRFDGDVLVKGSVKEGTKVVAGGEVIVYGSVYGAEIISRGNVKVYGKVINSKITAGGNMILYLVVLPKMERILSFIEKALHQVMTVSSDHGGQNIGRLVYEIINNHGPLEELLKEVEMILSLLDDEKKKELSSILDRIKYSIIGIHALHIHKQEQIQELCNAVCKYVQGIKAEYLKNVDIEFGYSQNSFLQSGGCVISTGQGCYQTRIVAKNRIVFRLRSSVVRGGVLIAGKHIRAGIVGSPAGIRTYCRVLDPKGKINAEYYYDNTYINVGGRSTVVKSDVV